MPRPVCQVQGLGKYRRKHLKYQIEACSPAYCAYSYLVDADTAAYGEEIGFHIKGWVSVPSGHAEYIQYRSKYQPNVYFILENKLENDSEIAGNEHYIPAPLLDAIKDKKKPSAEKFAILEDLAGEIVSVSGADEFNMKVRLFYPGKNVVIPGPVEIVESQEMEEFDGEYSRVGFVRSGTDYALLFATNDYYPPKHVDPRKHGKYWEDLNTPIRDAEILGQELANYGFNVDIRKDVKTRTDILKAIAEYAGKDYKTGDQLFVYFAGHGYFNTTLKDGYIAAGDSKLPKYDTGQWSSYLAYARTQTTLR